MQNYQNKLERLLGFVFNLPPPVLYDSSSNSLLIGHYTLTRQEENFTLDKSIIIRNYPDEPDDVDIIPISSGKSFNWICESLCRNILNDRLENFFEME